MNFSAYGVPAEWINDVKNATEDTLLGSDRSSAVGSGRSTARTRDRWKARSPLCPLQNTQVRLNTPMPSVDSA